MTSINRYLFWLSLICLPHFLTAQMIHIETDQEPLQQVLEKLASTHDLQYTTTAAEVSLCQISIDKRFRNLEAALQALTATCDLTCRKLNDVFVIGTENQAAETQQIRAPKPLYTFQGVLLDAESQRALPHVIVQSPNGCILSDHDGSFSIRSTESQLRLKAKHLAYRLIDTSLHPGSDHQLRMQPKDYCLEDIWIKSESSDHILSAKYPISKAYMEGTLVAGFYASFDEFINNNPSIAWTNPERKERIAFPAYTVQNFMVQTLKIPGNKKQQIRKIIGYCDGQEIYFRVYTRYNGFSDRFAPIRFAGQFVTHPSNPQHMFSPAGRYNGLYNRANSVLNMENGQYFYLDKRNLRKLIQPNQALLASFERESQKEAKLLMYFLKFIETQL